MTNAIVAFAAGDDTYDLYHSENGGLHCYLGWFLAAEIREHGIDPDVKRPVLQTEEQATVARLTEAVGDDLGQVEIRNVNAPAIEPNPFAVNVPRAQIGQHVNGIDYDVLYLVTDSGVETYLTAWVVPTYLILASNAVMVDIFDPEMAPDHPEEFLDAIKQKRLTADQSYKPWELTPRKLRTDDEYKTLWTHYSRQMFSLLASERSDDYTASDEDHAAVLWDEDYRILLTTKHYPQLREWKEKRGPEVLFIRMSLDYKRPLERYVVHQNEVTTPARNQVAEDRFEVAYDLLTRQDISPSEDIAAEASLVEILRTQFNGQVAEFSHIPENVSQFL